ncbi:YtxH domain-containing protein [Acetobacteroides hydrogenigenes]|jgi:gas vesicle protein|uniref:YtxH-like protein n=1 Tax=Acetobacteroides hydrogenigenes TaxID=979970 RepID=A0A4R2ESK6_9BACT|nr:YtxH domain-containing protein [Acetobacteroides hydrogenigenes]TCN70606.1 YtxH-like protein [Acetobacteroides hydrogenigenes]
MTTGKVVLGVLAGVAVGALIGVLFAPDKGCETRRKISKRSHDLAEDLKESFSRVVDDIAGRREKASSEGEGETA